jgi:hypothetical protein
MTKPTYISSSALRGMSQAEREQYMDDLVRAGMDDGRDWDRLYRVWEKCNE